MEDVVVKSTASADFNVFLLTIFAGRVPLLCTIGIYGLMAYSIRQRHREIGVRIPLGAEPRKVRNMVLCREC